MGDKKTKKVDVEDLTKVEKPFLNDGQLKYLLTKTPEDCIRKRVIKFQGEVKYVTGTHIKKVLNHLFGWDWDFIILDEKIMIESKTVIVKGKLVCRHEGREIVRMQYGSSELEIKLKNPVNLGFSLKAAATDALKKCASDLGIASDIYAADEFKEIEVVNTRPEVKDELEELILLHESKKELLDPKQEIHILRIIDNEEATSYKKAIKTLKEL